MQLGLLGEATQEASVFYDSFNGRVGLVTGADLMCCPAAEVGFFCPSDYLRVVDDGVAHVVSTAVKAPKASECVVRCELGQVGCWGGLLPRYGLRGLRRCGS